MNTSDILKTERIAIPKVGLGTYKLTGREGVQSIEDALHIGYRHIDTAQLYENEEEVGKAVRQSGIDRAELFITTKIWPSDFRRLLPAVENSLRKLKMEQVDLLLLHWPSDDEANKAGLEALNGVLHKQYARTTGVSNFTLGQLETALALAPVCCNQVEYHPFISQQKMMDRLKANDMVLTAYRPLAMGKVANDPVLQDIAASHNKTPGQIALRWLVQQGNVAVIPKASSAGRRRENRDIFGFELTSVDMERIFALNRNERLTNPSTAPNWD